MNESRSPFSPGIILHGPKGNPALMTAHSNPSSGLQFPSFFPCIGHIGNNEIIIPEPFSLLTGRVTAGNYFSRLMIESFELEGLTPDQVSARIASCLSRGLELRSSLTIPLLKCVQAAHAFSSTAGYGLDISSHFNGVLFFPGEPLAAVFSSKRGLQPGNTIAFNNFAAEIEMCTDFTAAFSRNSGTLSLARLGEIQSHWGIALSCKLGHSFLLMKTDRGQIVYSTDNILSMQSRGKIIAAGLGFHERYKIDNPLKSGFPCNGWGFGLNGGMVLRKKNAALSVYARNIGFMAWNKNILQADISLQADSIFAWNLINGTQTVNSDPGTFTKRKPFVYPLHGRMLAEFSYRWRNPEHLQRKLDNLSSYRIVSAGYHQPLCNRNGIPTRPGASISLENGFLKGTVPVRISWLLGEWEKYASCIEFKLVDREFTYTIWYRSIGDLLFRPRTGLEIGAVFHVFWGFSE
ncbi:MAG: hypothetical protein GF350_04490 [Chitinivibrionales bacterium]|nr:hypothetical protein [Chitinivibrionales bacterium]